MAERVFCIDLGSGYTKVGLRTAPTADTTLLASPTVLAGGVDFCLPTVVAVDQTSGTRQYEFGYRALDRKPGDKVRVFSNWKRWAFEAGNKLPSGLPALLASDDFAALAGRYQVPLAEVNGLRQLVAASHQLNGGPPPTAELLAVRQAGVLAEKFFRFLRTFVLDACRRMEHPPADLEDVPAVLTAPAFAPEGELTSHPGVKLLSAALVRAGWKVRDHHPVVSEPFSNAVGVLTGGVNAVRRTPKSKTHAAVTRIDLGKMFKKGPIITAASDGEHFPLYRALVVDVGAYTTDVAVVELPAAEMDDFTPAAVRVRQSSVPLGVHEIDDRVRAVLPPRQAAYLTDTMSSADWEDFRQTVYDGANAKPYKTLEGNIGGKKDAPAIRAALEAFGGEVAAHVVGFCGDLSPANMQELILTGGGNAIPAVRAALESAVRLPGNPIARVLAPARRTSVADAVARHLDDRQSRGGSALGGCSIFFEPAYW
jgi:hypothetical protein